MFGPKRTLPTQSAQHFEFGIGNIGGDAKIDRQLSEPLQFIVSMVHDVPLCGIVIVQQYTPCHIDGVLLRQTLVVILDGDGIFFGHELSIRDTTMISIVDQCRQQTAELNERVRCDYVWSCSVIITVGDDRSLWLFDDDNSAGTCNKVVGATIRNISFKTDRTM
jgi:hypothetical protein